MLTFSQDPNVAEQQMTALIFYLTAFGYVDGNFDFTEKTFVRFYIRQLVTARAHALMPSDTAEQRASAGEVIERFVAHFHELFEQIDRHVRELFSEAVADKEQVETFVYAKLKLRCYEIFRSFDAANQRALLDTLDELIYADGTAHPAETKFRAELQALLESDDPLSAQDLAALAGADILAPVSLSPAVEDHPFFATFEHHYSAQPERIRMQADADRELMQRFTSKLAELRRAGAGQLTGKRQLSELAASAPLLDGHIFVHPARAKARYELIVLGDLHGCYSCLKAAVLQSDFFAKLEAWRLDPRKPEPKLVLLGDYIDRGRFSYNGVLRTVMQLFLAAPDHVFPLRGNHEYYVEYGGRVYGGVKPAEAINSLVGYLPDSMFEAYMRLFEDLPTLLFFDTLMFVHAGIPRDKDVQAKVTDLASLNDPELRFQMLWSDPAHAEAIPDELQAQNARFPFGRRQFESFMKRFGATVMVRGHERVDEGFRDVYPGNAITLINLFSAGGADNGDLPPDSSYRAVTPMACTIQLADGTCQITPWAIDYKRFNAPSVNRFFASEPEISHKG
ncbi:MAG: serine/threonine protein phosphatase [Myxococcales bacterium]|nr:serine/threonine protein phosphatase [Myxococcales bacterium]